MKYEVTVTGIGEMAYELLNSFDGLIIFDESAPPELAEISILHSTGEVEGEIQVGDQVTVGRYQYRVTAVGDEAISTLKSMGHCTLKFTGHSTVDLPGQIELEGEKRPEILVGDVIRFM